MTLFRPVNQAELDLIRDLDWKAFPPRLPGQPIFYPVTNERYANEITEQWNVPAYGTGYVVRFAVDDAFTSRYEIQTVGLDHHTELWILAEDLDGMNANIIGAVELVGTFGETSS
jgi:hypothetical protein